MESNLYKVSKNKTNNYIYLDPLDEEKHQYTLIFLHGLGDSSAGFFDVFAYQQVVSPNCRVVLPTAPKCPVSCNNGYAMTSWFDIFNLDGKTPATNEEVWKEYNQEDLAQSAALLLNLVDDEASKLGGDTSRIFIGGFSQGCMVSIAAFLKYRGAQPLGGLIGLSGM